MACVQITCLVQTSVGPVLAASVPMCPIRHVPGTSLVIRVRGLWLRCEMCPYRLMSLNTWSPVMALCCETVESYRDSASVEEVSHREVDLGVYFPAVISFYFLFPNGKCNMTSHFMQLPLYLSEKKPFLKLLHLFVEPWLSSDLNCVKPKEHSIVSGLTGKAGRIQLGSEKGSVINFLSSGEPG